MCTKKTLLVFMIILAAVLIMPPAMAAPRYGGNLRVTINSDPSSFDPMLEGSESEQIPAAHIFETALALDPKGTPFPSVCMFKVSQDGKVIELTPRKGVKFHSGAPVTALDIEASAKRWLANVGFAKTHVGANLENIKIAGGSLIFSFSKPAPLALTAIGTWDRGLYILPKTVCEKYPGSKIEKADLIGTGPYKFKDHQNDRFVLLEKFKGYVPNETGAKGLAAAKYGYADTLYFYTVSDKTARITGVQTGEYDIGIGVPANMLSQLGKTPELRVEIKDLGIMACLIFNFKEGRCADVNLRNAILSCLNMDELMMAAQGDKSLYYLNPSIMQKSSRWWTDENLGKYNKPDIAKAKEYLKKSSYDGKPLVFITTKSFDYFYKTALMVQQMVKPAGITIDLRVYDNPTLQQFRNQPDKFDMFSAGLTAKLDPTLVAYMEDGWAGFYSSERKSKYYKILTTESDFDKRYRAWVDMTKVLYEEIPAISFGERAVAVVVRSKVQDVFDTTQKYYWNTWLAE